MSSIANPLIAIVGPTGSGKSELALHLAKHFSGEIVNYDSVQVYRGLDIGSAKVTERERQGIPHHLIDVAEPDADYTAGEYARQSKEVLAEISRRGKIPILVGGTGFYLRALLEGLSPAPPRDVGLRGRLQALAARRPLFLHRYLRRFDPFAAAKIHPRDLQKLIRAIEITKQANQPASQIQNLPKSALKGYFFLKFGLNPDRQALHQRINQRAECMFRQGLIEETSLLLKGGISAQAKSLQSLGYRQAVQVLKGSISMETAIQECQTKTRQYAKRQLTWFRAEKEVHWLNGFGSDQRIKEEAVSLAGSVLATGF